MYKLQNAVDSTIAYADAYGGALEDALDAVFEGLSREGETDLLLDLWRRAEPGSRLGEAFLAFLRAEVGRQAAADALAVAQEMTPAAAERVRLWAEAGAAVPAFCGGAGE